MIGPTTRKWRLLASSAIFLFLVAVAAFLIKQVPSDPPSSPEGLDDAEEVGLDHQARIRATEDLPDKFEPTRIVGEETPVLEAMNDGLENIAPSDDDVGLIVILPEADDRGLIVMQKPEPAE